MAGALYFIAPNRKPLFASRKVESDKTAEEELSSGGEQSPENEDDNDSKSLKMEMTTTAKTMKLKLALN